MISSRNIIEHGCISARQSTSHFCSMACRSLSLRALSSSTIFNSALAEKRGAIGSMRYFDSKSWWIMAVLRVPASCTRLFDGRFLRSLFGDNGPERLDRCFLRGGLSTCNFVSFRPGVLIWLTCGEELRRLRTV